MGDGDAGTGVEEFAEEEEKRFSTFS